MFNIVGTYANKPNLGKPVAKTNNDKEAKIIASPTTLLVDNLFNQSSAGSYYK